MFCFQLYISVVLLTSDICVQTFFSSNITFYFSLLMLVGDSTNVLYIFKYQKSWRLGELSQQV